MIDKQKELEIVSSVIGIPYQVGAMGPDKYDCWGLVRFIEKELFDRELQIIVPPDGKNPRELVKFIKEHTEHQNWEKIENPIHGCIVEMSNSNHPHHIGVYLDIDGGGILHCCVAGVAFDSLFNLKSAGWRKLVFYKHKENHE